MADIELLCPGCGDKTMVSEYIAESSVPCRTCNQQLPVPKFAKPSRLKFKKPEAAAPAPAEAPAAGARLIPTASVLHRPRQHAASKHVSRFLISLLSWLLFCILAGGLFYLRFFNTQLLGIPLELFKHCGLIAIGAGYLLTISIALKDDMFSGLLSIVVPGYAYYYLFFMSGAVFLRAITAALLLAFGFDLLVLLKDVAQTVFIVVSNWITHAAD